MDMTNETRERGFTTAILHGDRDAVIEHGAVHKPLHLSVAYGYRDAADLIAVFQGRASGYAYGRQGNPTTAALEAKVTAMEQGVATVCFATGMAAIGAIMMSLLRGDDHVVSSSFVFGNTNSLLGTMVDHGTPITFVDATSAENVERALTPRTRLVFVETIANPRTQVADLVRIGALCRERGLIYVVDNTMTSPWLFRPATVDASLVVNALTKYIGGHGNALGGAVTDTGRFDWTRFPNIAQNYKSQKPALWGITQLRKKGLRDFGATLGAEQAHHIAVGAETLALRMDRQCANAQALAEFLVAHPKVRPSTTRGSPGTRSTGSPGRCSAHRARCSRSNSPMAATCSRCSTACAPSCCRRTSATTAASPSRSPRRSTGRWGRRAAPRWASPIPSCACRWASRTGKT
jgi:O-acetylhomoserine (thiol)-lyase